MSAGGTPPGSFDFWRVSHRALRGRYRIAALLALCGAVAGAGMGFSLGKRLYSATGLVRIAAALPQVMRETDQNRPIAMFDGFIQAQREVMGSREVVLAAMQQEAWQKLPQRRRTMSDEQFASRLKVETRPRSDHLRVTFSHTDPVVAAAAVQSVVAAYQQVFAREQHGTEGSRLDLLRQRRASISTEMEGLDASARALADGRTLAEIEPLYQEASERLKKVRSAVTDIQIAMAGGPDSSSRFGGQSHDPGELAETEMLRLYVDEQTRLELDLLEAQARGLTPAHPNVIRMTAAIKACRERIALVTQAGEQRQADKSSEPTPKSLRERETSLRALAQASDEELQRLAGQRDRLRSIDEQAVALRQQLADTDSRLDALTTEASMGGRLAVVTGGDRPMTALVDNRAKMTAAGAFVGMFSPVGVMVLGTTLRRRYRTGEDVAEDFADRVPFVAVLPELGADARLGIAAARCIHALRVRLQPPAGSSRMYLLSSASGGEGKSALSLSLGLSFAQAGFRTLLIDGDLTGRGLTLGFGAGESSGLFQAIAGEEPKIHRLGAGLSVLTAGRCLPHDACRVAPDAVRRALSALRSRFDVVLIDGDAIGMGVTAPVIAPHVDGVVLAIARGQEQSSVRRATARLASLGAVLTAAAFNRAAPADFATPSAGMSPPAEGRPLHERLRRFGPLVGAVLSSLSLSREEDLDLVGTAMTLARTDVANHSREGEHGDRQPGSRSVA